MRRRERASLGMNLAMSGIDVTAGASTTAFLYRASVGGALALLEEKNTASASPENVLQESCSFARLISPGLCRFIFRAG